MDIFIDSLGYTKIIAILDTTSGYFQIEVQKANVRKQILPQAMACTNSQEHPLDFVNPSLRFEALLTSYCLQPSGYMPLYI